jgi:hypothetical protein
MTSDWKDLRYEDGRIMEEILKELRIRNVPKDGKIKDHLTEEDLDRCFERVEDFLPEDGIFWKKVIFGEGKSECVCAYCDVYNRVAHNIYDDDGALVVASTKCAYCGRSELRFKKLGYKTPLPKDD